MTKRGKILRDTNAGPGLLIVDGTQHPFQLEQQWQSDLPPKVGMVVDVDIDPAGQVTGVRAVADGILAREQADQAMQAVREKGGAVAGAMVSRFGGRDLAALGLLLLGWFVLRVGSFGGGLMGEITFTFWQVLGYVNAGAASIGSRAMGGNASTGIWGFFALAAIVGPFVHHFWKDRRAYLLGLLPLLLMLVVLFKVYGGLGSSVGDATSLFGSDGAEMAAQMRREMRNAVTLGIGTYLSFAVAGYFALGATRRWLASRA
jgi:hypothetical protein